MGVKRATRWLIPAASVAATTWSIEFIPLSF